MITRKMHTISKNVLAKEGEYHVRFWIWFVDSWYIYRKEDLVMRYDNRMWNYCYNTAYIILDKKKADLMLNTLKDVGGPHGFICGTTADFELMMSDAMKANDEVREIVKEYIAGVEEHNKKHLVRMKRRFLRK